jgi:hypothetical protein
MASQTASRRWGHSAHCCFACSPWLTDMFEACGLRLHAQVDILVNNAGRTP